MSQRSCDHLTGGQLCHTICHESRKVGLPGSSPVWVRLCFAHRNTDDDTLVTMAKAKIDRRTEPADIQTPDIASGLLIQDKTTKGLARVISVTPTGVTVRQAGGQFNGCSHAFLKKTYGLPVVPKHSTI